MCEDDQSVLKDDTTPLFGENSDAATRACFNLCFQSQYGGCTSNPSYSYQIDGLASLFCRAHIFTCVLLTMEHPDLPKVKEKAETPAGRRWARALLEAEAEIWWHSCARKLEKGEY